jgi:hypothetical protein
MYMKIESLKKGDGASIAYKNKAGKRYRVYGLILAISDTGIVIAHNFQSKNPIDKVLIKKSSIISITKNKVEEINSLKDL